jgi:hypothetical protein
MIQKIRKFIVVTLASLTLLSPGLVPAFAATAFAASSITNNLCTGTNYAVTGNTAGTDCGTSGTGSGTTDLSTLAGKIVNIFSVVVGVVAVIMIIYGGFRYITSGGDSGSVGNAKNTLIYAIVGLIIVALAQIIVHYVLNTATTTVTTT